MLNSYGRQETAASAAETMNGSKNVDTSKFGSYTLDGGDNYRELLMSLPNDDVIAKVHDLRTEFSNLLSRTDNISVARKSEIKEQLKPLETLYEGFSNSHFDKPNILAHLRMKDRVDTDGNKTLLLEEVQSDWHQTGADVGYKSKDGSVSKPLQDEMDRIEQEMGRIYEASRASDDPDVWMPLNEQFDNLNSELGRLKSKSDGGVPDAPFKTDDKSSWYNLALKRGLLEAVEGGYDRLALTTGRQQAERYDLSNQIGSMRLREEIIPNNKASGGDPLGSRKMFLLDAFDLDGNKVINRRIDNPEKELPNIIGKEVSKKLLNQEAGVLYPDVPSSTAKVKILNGLDLSVGGEGMKQFYDRTLPNALNKMVKQDGVKVSESNLIGKTPSKTEIASASDREELITLRDKIFNGDDTSPTHDRYNELLAKYQPKPRTDAVHSIDITPKMRERVKKGLPLFATGGAAIGLTEMMSQQQQEDQRSGLFNSLQY